MNQEIIKTISEELNVRVHQIEAVLSLLEEGNTVPFIARYRKEMTGSLDEVAIREIEERHAYLTGLVKRKEEVLRIIEEQGKLTDSLAEKIKKAERNLSAFFIKISLTFSVSLYTFSCYYWDVAKW